MSVARSLMVVLAVSCLLGADETKKARLYYQRGMVKEMEKKFEDALADYTRAVTFDPKFAEAWWCRGSLYSQRGEHHKAIDDLTKLIELEPRRFSAIFNRALEYGQTREYDKSIADYTRIIEGDIDFSNLVDSKTSNLAHTYHYRGRAYQWYKKDHARAAADFTRALELDPKIEMVLHRRADAYHALKQYAKAHGDYEVSLKQSPDYPNALANFAWQLATCPDPKLRDGKRAVELAIKANNSFTPNLASHMDALAAAYAEIGRFDEAIQWQEKVLEALKTTQFNLRPGMQERLTLYRSRKPFREE